MDKIIDFNDKKLKEVFELASKAGVTIEETEAMLKILADYNSEDIEKLNLAGLNGAEAGKKLREVILKLNSENKYNGLPSVDASMFNGYPEDERFYSFFFDGENTEAVEMLEMEKILAGNEYNGELLALALRNTKIFIATTDTITESILAAMASGCLVLAPVCVPDVLTNGFDFKDNVHLSFYLSNQDLREQIEFFLHNRIKRVYTARNGQYFVTSNHTDKIRQGVNKCA